MRILILNWRDIKNPSSGGAEILTHEMAKRWVNGDHQVIQFSSYFPGCLPEEIVDKVKIIRRGNPDARSGINSVHFSAFRYYHQALKGKLDIVIDEFHGLPFFTPWYVEEKKVALICEVAGGLWKEIFGPLYGWLGELTEKFSLTSVYKDIPFLTISNSTKTDLLKHTIPERNITVLPVGLTIPSGIAGKEKKENELTLILVGRLTKQKGVEDGILALKEIRKKYKRAKLWIVGRGDDAYVASLETLAQKLNLSGSIIFFGFVSEKEKFTLLARAHVLIAPSSKEGWGINVIEASAAATPSIGYNVAGLRDSIREDTTGYLTTHNTPYELASRVLHLMGNKYRYVRMAKAAKMWAKNFSWDNTANVGINLLQKVYEEKF